MTRFTFSVFVALLLAAGTAQAQAIDKAQLLTGKPTSRQAVEGQVRQEYVYEVTQRIISDPGAVDIARVRTAFWTPERHLFALRGAPKKRQEAALVAQADLFAPPAA